jgi:xylulokinase
VTILTVDLGTSSTKAVLWSDERVVAIARTPIVTSYPGPGLVEQDPDEWCTSVARACDALRHEAPRALASVSVVGFTGARETFSLFDHELRPLGPGIVWSDARATDEIALFGSAREFRKRTGVVLGESCCAAKLAWVRDRQPQEFARAAWILSPRDYVVARLTGLVATDRTFASRTGLYSLGGESLADEFIRSRLPPVLSSLTVERVRHPELIGVPVDAQVILGAGDRACEALGAGATAAAPMVSWGTTANLSVPHLGPLEALPQEAQVSVGAAEGYLIEAGLSAAGSALTWLERLTRVAANELFLSATSVPIGAQGLLAFPWLHGARAPWWQPHVHAAFVGITTAHGPPEFARALIEGVALDVGRSVELVASAARRLVATGGGAGQEVWISVLSGATGLPVARRALDEGASVGARLLVAAASGDPLTVDDVNPLRDEEVPTRSSIHAFQELRANSDRIAANFVDAALP